MAEQQYMGLTVGTANLAQEDSIKLRTLILELDHAVEQRLPGYSSMLAQIHGIIKQDPAQVTLLAPEDAAVIVRAMSTRVGEVFEEKTVKKASTRVAAAAKKGILGDML